MLKICRSFRPQRLFVVGRFIDNGRRWRCPVCLLSNTVPDDFFYDPTTKTYGDPARRPEIRNATVEFIAPSDYMVRPPQAATYLFCLEVSRIAVTAGYLELVCNMIADNLDKMPGDSRRQVGILTYDSGVQFYVFNGKKMKMVICQDLSEVFLPDLNGMVNRVSDCAESIIELLRQIPEQFASTQDTSNCLGFALQTALKLIGNTGGRLSVFNVSIPNVGPGKMENRGTHEDLTKPNPDNLRPSSDFYRTLALEFSQAYISVDMFMLNSNYCDIATISGVSRYSGGSVYHYPNFHYDPEVYGPLSVSSESGDSRDVQPVYQNQQKKVAPHELCDYVEVESLRKDFQRYLTRKIGFEAVLRVRCSRGVNVQNFYGNFFMRSVDLLNLPVVNPDAGYALQLEVNDRLDSFPQIVLQSALLYTSAYGDRRIRVHTLCLPVTDSPETVFNYADEGAIACLVTKMAVERTISAGLGNAREALTTVMNDILTAYENERNSGSSRSSTLSGICPASLRLLPAYLCGALRFPAFRNHLPTSLDIRSGALEQITGASASQILALLYPRLYSVNSFISEPLFGKDATLLQKAAALSLDDSASLSTPPSLPCLPLTGKSITRDGVYLLDTGNLVLLLVGYGIPSADLKSLIGYSSIDELTVEKAVTKLGDLPEGEKIPLPRKRLQTLIKSIQRERYLGTALALIRHDVPEPLKGLFINALVEDKSPTCPSYSEYVQMILNGNS
nr:protein transport protein Sec24B [Hymenolepis microstoma]